MTLKELYAPSLGRNVKFGRRIPTAVAPHLKLRNYLRATLPSAPSSLDLSSPALPSLRNVDQNDVLGDCVIAGANHILGVLTGNAGALYQTTAAQILSEYGAIGGYVPGNPATDNGCNMTTALNWFTQNPMADGTKLTAWLGVDATNVAELQAAMFLFENLYFGMALPDAWVNPMPSSDGFTWDVAGKADPNNGHCVMGFGYDTTGVKIDSWALFGTLTYKAIAEYAVAATGGELYVMLSSDVLLRGAQKAPNGVAWTDLITDWDSIGGSVAVPAAPTPAPAPSPAPTPVPAVSVSLAQVEAWLAAGINSGLPLQTRSQAIALANAQLSKNWPKS